jgi:hypothetical protein
MPKLQLVKHPKAKRAPSKASNVVSRRLRTEAGEVVTVYAIDTNSPTFANDFLYVFAQNVKKAREENRERFGSPDGPADPS